MRYPGHGNLIDLRKMSRNYVSNPCSPFVKFREIAAIMAHVFLSCLLFLFDEHQKIMAHFVEVIAKSRQFLSKAI